MCLLFTSTALFAQNFKEIEPNGERADSNSRSAPCLNENIKQLKQQGKLK